VIYHFNTARLDASVWFDFSADNYGVMPAVLCVRFAGLMVRFSATLWVPLVCYIISDLTDLTVCEYAS
jgi:hypothetical protein